MSYSICVYLTYTGKVCENGRIFFDLGMVTVLTATDMKNCFLLSFGHLSIAEGFQALPSPLLLERLNPMAKQHGAPRFLGKGTSQSDILHVLITAWSQNLHWRKHSCTSCVECSLLLKY